MVLEDPDFCNLKLVEAVIENVPQLILQMFAAFILAQQDNKGWNQFMVISIVISLFAMSQTLSMLLDRSILPKDQPQDEEDDEEEKGFSIKKMCQKLCGLLFCYVSEGSLAMKDFGSSLISSLS